MSKAKRVDPSLMSRVLEMDKEKQSAIEQLTYTNASLLQIVEDQRKLIDQLQSYIKKSTEKLKGTIELYNKSLPKE